MPRIRRRITAASLALALGAVTSFAQANPPAKPAAAKVPHRNPYFGETHLHTSWSFDAYVFGNRITGPAEAYEYAQGKAIKHPLGFMIKIETPLDWMGVTDHAEYAGVVRLANDPSSAISKLPVAESLKVRTPDNVARIYLMLGTTMIENKPIKSLVSPEVAGTVWQANNAAANAANKPGKFTAFCSYEWTSAPQARNMHRNVFFRDCAKLPAQPFSALDSQDPSDLWNWMDGQRSQGNELLAISHNANLSDGHMYPIDVDEKGRPIDAAWAASRERNERLIEIKQIKGQSEAHPLLSPNDEFANYEIMSWLIATPQGVPAIPGSYVRQALKDGITMQDVWGFNPYKTGFTAGSDSHNSASPYRQSNFFGGHAGLNGTPETRMAGFYFGGMDVRYMNPGGIAGVWAEENTRASIFDAMQRRETFGTSGPHIKIRMFGGWKYTAAMLGARDWADKGYTMGVPMGSDLPAMAGRAPTIMVWAMKDPASGNLDRLQIVKGWSKSGQSFERIYDVAWSGNRRPNKFTGRVGPVGSTVDIANATYTNTIGNVELKAVWTDPNFEPGVHAFYYARVLEIPTPRWTTIQAKDLGIAPPEIVAATVQERAWGSPIWYTPSTDARKAAPAAGMSVADLKAKGYTQVMDAELAAMFVNKATWIKNDVTGGVVQVSAAPNGNFMIFFADPAVPQPSDFGEVTMRGTAGDGAHYEIKDGRINTMVGNAPFSYTLYKLDKKVYLARSNEFGYANYEVVAEPQFLAPSVMAKMKAAAGKPAGATP